MKTAPIVAFSRKHIVKHNSKTLSAAMVYISARIPAELYRRLDIACHASGLKKQAIIAAGISAILQKLQRRTTKAL